MFKRLAIGCVLASMAISSTSHAGGSEFSWTYQGRMTSGGQPYNGTSQIDFRVYTAPSGGTQVATGVAAAAQFSNGLVTADARMFPGSSWEAALLQPLFLEVEVDGTVLQPRQLFNAAPRAEYSTFTRGIKMLPNLNGGIGAAYSNVQFTIQSDDNVIFLARNGDAEDVFAINEWGNVGIGADYSAATLNVRPDADDVVVLRLEDAEANTLLQVRPDGNAGIGTSAYSNVRLNVRDDGTNGFVFHVETTDGNELMSVLPNGITRTQILQITGGSDIAEPFDVSGDTAVVPGMVVAIDPANPGELRVADVAYDRTVAGIISGANGVNTGMTLSQSGTISDGAYPVALTGRVWCTVDADAAGAIQPGDLLTTSGTPGHAMKAADHAQAQGAILGKAMTSLESGRGMVLVLVSLQ